MGDENKLLLPFNGSMVISQICHTVLNSGLKPVIVVTGFQHKAVEKALPELIDQIAYNPNWEQGMAGSIYTGMSLLPDTVVSMRANRSFTLFIQDNRQIRLYSQGNISVKYFLLQGIGVVKKYSNSTLMMLQEFQ